MQIEDMKKVIIAEIDRQSGMPAAFSPYFDGDYSDKHAMIDGTVDLTALAAACVKAAAEWADEPPAVSAADTTLAEQVRQASAKHCTSPEAARAFLLEGGLILPDGSLHPNYRSDEGEQPAVSPTLAQDGETHAEGPETAADAETPSTGAENEKDGDPLYGDHAPPPDDLTDWNVEKAKALLKQHRDYSPLWEILVAAHQQSSQGKGRVRHANGRPWLEQPIMTIGRDVGLGYPTGQALKKIQEAVGMVSRGEREAAVAEILGAIVYAAAAVQLIREGE